jgi:hypothetical protein
LLRQLDTGIRLQELRVQVLPLRQDADGARSRVKRQVLGITVKDNAVALQHGDLSGRQGAAAWALCIAGGGDGRRG